MNQINISKFFTKSYIWRWTLVLLIASIPVFGNNALQEAYWTALSDAYLQVTVFVAMTLALFYGLETFLKIDTASILKKHKAYQIPISAVIGALPGCGGAIMIMTQYSAGRLGFGSVIAVLTATMGDAAFLLIAKEPTTALLVFGVALTVGILFGYLVEWIHGYEFLKPQPKESTKHKTPSSFSFGNWKWPWIALTIPGAVLGLMVAFQINIDAYFNIPHLYLVWGSIGAILSLFLWFINPVSAPSVNNRFQGTPKHVISDKTSIDTCFVTVWVIIAYLLYEVGEVAFGWNLANLFNNIAPLVPLIAIVIGFIPGCGPQVLVTSMYLDGLIPLSAQIGNAISNDGDALFPAMAVSPRASIIATFYTSVPALLVAYSFYFAGM